MPAQPEGLLAIGKGTAKLNTGFITATFSVDLSRVLWSTRPQSLRLFPMSQGDPHHPPLLRGHWPFSSSKVRVVDRAVVYISGGRERL